MFGFLRRKASGSPEQRFWQWFQDHEAELFAYDPATDGHSLIHRVGKQLTKVDSGLTLEFGPPLDGRREFVISAGGIKDLFPAVRRLLEAAPDLPRWTVTAFRPRRPDFTEMQLRIGDLDFDPAEITFLAEPDGEKLDLVLYLPGYEPTPDHLFEQAGFLFLDQALGEYDVATRIGAIDFRAADQQPGDGAHPLTELPALVDRLRTSG
jgi:hypothetical protein